jgi:2-polyprenyl-6-methoxyphenol hydroxylase-like FAD-dependent oxidoreductase
MLYTIVGAGIGGLTTALAFEKCGIEYQVFEKTPELNEVGAGIWLPPNALQVFEWLGVLKDIEAKGNSIDRVTIGTPDLSPLSDSPQHNVKDKFGYSTIAIHRAELQKLLFQQVPKEKIYLGKSFKEFKEIEQKRVQITFNDNSKVETDFLIAADGINSKIRRQLFPTSKIRYSGQTCWRGIADYTMDADFEHRGIELWGNQIRFGISKVAKDKVYWFAVSLSKPNQKDDDTLVKDKLLKTYANFHQLVKTLITTTSQNKIVRNDISDLIPLKYWYKNNICLIGDAGHATTPNMGQGGAQAIEDAYYLSNLIKNKGNENVFQLFQEKRKQKVNLIVQKSWNTGKIAHWKYGKGMINFMLKRIPARMIQKKINEIYQLEKKY